MNHGHTNLEIDEYLGRLTPASSPEWGKRVIIRYDAARIDAAIETECGPEPRRGTAAWECWRVLANRIRNRELNALRGAVTSCGLIVYEPIMEEVGIC